MRTLPIFFLITDIGFVLYWLITLAGLIPASYLFKDYDNPILAAWNWSFLPLDLLISATGFTSLYLKARNRPVWLLFATVSLVLTACSGLQAIAFWVIRGDFDPAWWAPNLFLLIFPLFFLVRIFRSTPANQV